MSLRKLYNSKVNIVRVTKTQTQGTLGGWTETLSVLHRDLPCRINWISGSKRIYFDKDTYFRDAKLYCDVVDVTTEDRVQYKGQVYKIVDVADTDELSKFLVLTLRLLK